MGSPFFFSHFVYLWEVAQVRHSKWNQVTLPSALHLKIPIVFSLWVVSRPKLPHLQLPFPLYEARHQEQRCSEKSPDDLQFAPFYYPLNNVSVIEISSSRVLWSCHLAFSYVWFIYIVSLNPREVRVCLWDLRDLNQEYRHSLNSKKLNRGLNDHMDLRVRRKKRWRGTPGTSGHFRRSHRGGEPRALRFILHDTFYLFMGTWYLFPNPPYGNLSVSSSWFSSAWRTPAANSPLFHIFLLP